jgi:hypothetical protein
MLSDDESYGNGNRYESVMADVHSFSPHRRLLRATLTTQSISYPKRSFKKIIHDA